MSFLRKFLLLVGGYLNIAYASDGSSAQQDGCVAVTGITGFVSGHIVEVLLREGYTIHGTVRDTSDAEKVGFLRDLDARLPGTLHMFNATLSKNDEDSAFEKAFKGCWGLLHVASPVFGERRPVEEFVDTAVDGTLSVLNAAKNVGIKAVIVTSSVVTVFPTVEKLKNPPGVNPYTVEDHSFIKSADEAVYSFSKIRAENATIEWLAKNGNPFRYASIHFPAAIGPQQSTRVTSSNKFVLLALIKKGGPLYAPLKLDLVDVRDVARAHVHVLLDERATGRYMVAPDLKVQRLTQQEINNHVKSTIPEASVPMIPMPLWFVRILVRLKLIPGLDWYLYNYKMVNPGPGFLSNMESLDFKYNHPDPAQSIRDAAISMVEFDIYKPSNSSPNKKIALFAIPVGLLLGRLLKVGEPKRKRQ